MGSDRATIATIDLAAIRANFAEARRHAGEREVIAVVKADAYGHGAVPVARTLVEAGCTCLAVVTLSEALELREAGLSVPLLLLGGAHDADEAEAVTRHGIASVVHHGEQLAWLAAAAERTGGVADIHIEVDTGMHRMGAPGDEALALADAVARTPSLSLGGFFTHLARADDPDPEPSLCQLARFRAVLATLRERGVEAGRIHALNSAGLLAGPRLADAVPEADAVRPGLILYGANPAPHLRASLRPAMSLRTRVVRVRRVAAGEAVGYAALFRALKPTRIATLALGYADGVPISASNRAHVIVRGRRLPVVGRVSMDYVTLDVGDEPVEVGDDALVFGEHAGARLLVEDAAQAAGTLSYEMLVRVGRRVPRVLVG